MPRDRRSASSTTSGGASSRAASDPSPNTSRPRWSRSSCRAAAHSWRTASAAGVSKSSSSADANVSHRSSSGGEGSSVNAFRKRVAAGSGLRHRLLRVVDRLAPRRGEEEDEDRLPPPLVERLTDRRHVAGRLRHLLARELEHPVVCPDRRERMTERARLSHFVLMVREHEVEPAAVDLERRPVDLLRHHRALDVPARPAATPRRVPPRVLGGGLVRLPEREVARVALQRARLLSLLDLVGLLTRQPAVLGEALDAEVHVATARVRVPARRSAPR